jgi:hypothetical protein
MSKFSDLVAIVSQPTTPHVMTPAELAHGAASAVQTSLFGRLRRTRGSAVAGRLGWLLVRAGSPDHVDCSAALDALAAMPVTELHLFFAACTISRDALKNAAAAALAGSICDALSRVIGGKSSP